MADLFTLTCDKLQDAAFVGFRGKEQISRPYEFDLFFTVPVGTAVKDAVGQRATLKILRSEDAEPILFYGVIAEVSLVHQNTNKKRTDQDRALYRALLVPRLWLLQQFWRSFVFVEKSVKEFLTDTLEAGGLMSGEFRFDIDAGSYPKEEFVAQYRESYLDFFHRWLEREGLYYFFEHKDGAGNEVLVIADDKGGAEAFPGGGKVRYFPIAGDDPGAPEALHELEAHVRWLPKTVTVADYNYSNPTSPVKGDSPVTSGGVGTIRDYGYRVFVESEAKRLAKVKAQAIGCRETTLRATGTSLGPRAGYKLTIDERPEDLEEEWLALEVEHTGVLRGLTGETARMTRLPVSRTYSMKLFAIPASVQYRAPQTTAWPRIYGFENGLVMGEADSPYAQIDADGRYLVRFEFDTSDLADGKVSTRVRMLQPHGGDKEGFHFPLRKGTEVMIAFLGGDCDRPFIAGVVPNAHKPSVVGKRNHTQNIIRTGSNNQLVMEDEQGKEFIFMQTPNQGTGIYMGQPYSQPQSTVFTGESMELFRNPDAAAPGVVSFIIPTVSYWPHTRGSAGFTVGQSYYVDIGAEQNWFVNGPVAHGYRNTYSLKVGGNHTEHFYSDQKIDVDGKRDEVVTGPVKETYGPQHTELKGNSQLEVRGDYFHKVDGKNDDNYGEWGTWVKGAWKSQTDDWTHKSPNVDWKIGTKIHMKAGANILIEAPEAKLKSTDEHWYTTTKHEFYMYKGSSGVFKTDHAAIYQSAYGVKIDYTAVKMENSPLKKYTYGFRTSTTIIENKDGGFTLQKAGFWVENSAAKKV